ncbi:hypothetical protein BGX38DRAFT_1234783 [Terfezia claveryi]|nr:hypothetical protein BGX38DRAFT_1234783 [Terfezia claveryi]
MPRTAQPPPAGVPSLQLILPTGFRIPPTPNTGIDQPALDVWPIRELNRARVERGDWAPVPPSIYNVQYRGIGSRALRPSPKSANHNASRTLKHYYQTQLDIFHDTSEGKLEWTAVQKLAISAACTYNNERWTGMVIASNVVATWSNIMDEFREIAEPYPEDTVQTQQAIKQFIQFARNKGCWPDPGHETSQDDQDETEYEDQKWNPEEVKALFRLAPKLFLYSINDIQHNLPSEVIMFLIYRLYLLVLENLPVPGRKENGPRHQPRHQQRKQHVEDVHQNEHRHEHLHEEQQQHDQHQQHQGQQQPRKPSNHSMERITSGLANSSLAQPALPPVQLNVYTILVQSTGVRRNTLLLFDLTSESSFDEVCATLEAGWQLPEGSMERKMQVCLLLPAAENSNLTLLTELGKFDQAWGTRQTAFVNGQRAWEAFINGWVIKSEGKLQKGNEVSLGITFRGSERG